MTQAHTVAIAGHVPELEESIAVDCVELQQEGIHLCSWMCKISSAAGCRAEGVREEGTQQLLRWVGGAVLLGLLLVLQGVWC